MRSAYDFWLLDLDGTVVDVEASYIHEVCTEVGDRLGVSFSARQAEHLWYGFGDTRERVFEATGVDAERFWDVFHTVDSPGPRAAATHISPDAAAFLDRVDAPLGLVTHCQAYLTHPILEAKGLAGQFDTVVCCTDETGWKPDPMPLEMAMTDLGVLGNGHEGAMVGDDPGDVGAAHNAGLTAVSVARHDPTRVGDPADGDEHVMALTELLESR